MAKKDATQEGVSEDTYEEDEVQSQPGSDRLEAMAEVAARHRQERDGEAAAAGYEVADTKNVEDIEEDPDEKPEKEEQDEQEQDDVQGEEQNEQDEDEPDNDEQEKLVTLKIDGKEVQVPEKDVIEAGIRAKQKESAADSRLEEATRILNEARQEAAKLQTPPPDKGADKSQSDGSEAINTAKILNAIRYGTEDEAQDALKQLMESGRSDATHDDQMTRDEVLSFVNEKAAFDKALADFQKSPEQGGFSDLWADPTLRKLVIQKESELRENGDNRSYSEVYTEIGTQVREWRDKLTGKQADNDFSKRQERKEENKPIKGGNKRASTAEDKKPVLTEEQRRQKTLDGMRQARHQIG